MPERQRVDPIGRILSAASMLMLAALALNLAVTLIRDVWVWIFGIAAVVGGVLALARLAIWWHRRRVW